MLFPMISYHKRQMGLTLNSDKIEVLPKTKELGQQTASYIIAWFLSGLGGSVLNHYNYS